MIGSGYGVIGREEEEQTSCQAFWTGGKEIAVLQSNQAYQSAIEDHDCSGNSVMQRRTNLGWLAGWMALMDAPEKSCSN